MFNHALGQLLPEVRHQGNCCASTREVPATWISIRTRGTKRCSCDKTAALARHNHTWISLRAQNDTSGEKAAAFSRREHSWISLRAQARRHVHATDCCVLTPQAQLDLSPCAKRRFWRKKCCILTPGAQLDLSRCASKKTCSCDRLLHSHATSTLGSLSVRKQTCSGKTTAAFSRREQIWISLRAQRDMSHRKHCCDLALPAKIDDFCLRTPDPVSTFKRAHVPYAIGNP